MCGFCDINSNKVDSVLLLLVDAFGKIASLSDKEAGSAAKDGILTIEEILSQLKDKEMS